MNPSSVLGAYSPHNPARAKHPKPFVHQHGVGHQTAAHRTILQNALGGAVRGAVSAVTGRRRRKKAPSATSGTRRRKRHASAGRSGSAHLVAGSQAAKSHMASLRKMRKGGKRKKKAA